MLLQSYLPASLPRWAYFFLAALCVGMGLWCSSITLQFFEHGANALETDPALQSLVSAAALMFVGSEMFAFALASLLTERQLQARRWMLYGFAGAVLAMEVGTIVLVQLAMTKGAEMSQGTVLADASDLQRRIDKIESGAAAVRSNAALQRAAGQLKKAGESDALAAAQEAEAKPLYEDLKAVRKQKRPTSTSLVGETPAITYAVVRGILVSMGGLVFFGTAGALLRAGRGGAAAPVEVQTLVLLRQLVDALGVPVPAFDALPAPALDAPAPALDAPAPALDAPADTDALLVRRRSEVGRLLVKGASKQTQQDTTGASEQTHPAPAGASEQTQPVTRVKAQPKHKSTAVAAGAKCDTGTGERDGERYRRVKAAVLSRKLEPGLRAIQKAEGGGAPTVRGYLAAMCNESIIRQLADGTYELIGGPA